MVGWSGGGTQIYCNSFCLLYCGNWIALVRVPKSLCVNISNLDMPTWYPQVFVHYVLFLLCFFLTCLLCCCTSFNHADTAPMPPPLPNILSWITPLTQIYCWNSLHRGLVSNNGWKCYVRLHTPSAEWSCLPLFGTPWLGISSSSGVHPVISGSHNGARYTPSSGRMISLSDFMVTVCLLHFLSVVKCHHP